MSQASRRVVWIYWLSGLGCLLVGGMAMAADADLPPELMAKQHLLEALRAVKAEDHKKAAAVFEKLFSLEEAAAPPEARLHYARSLLRIGRFDDAFREATLYLKDPGRSGKDDDEALHLRIEAGEQAEKTALDCGGGVTLETVPIPAGTFLMGFSPEERSRDDGMSQHRVTLGKPFHMGIYAVTQEQYRAVMDAEPSRFRGRGLPVENVSWGEAEEFCRKLSAKTGRKVRLPTEAEWEYACRAGTTTRYNVGETIDREQANFGDKDGKTTPAGSFPANAWGLYDMHGNVSEWCSDWYGDYPEGSATDPTGAASGKLRVCRGGSWYDGRWRCRSAYRDRLPPDSRDDHLGFRVVRE